VVVLPFDEYQRLAMPSGEPAPFLLASPLAGSELDVSRDACAPRDFEIEPGITCFSLTNSYKYDKLTPVRKVD
jgi:hypothetical protein